MTAVPCRLLVSACLFLGSACVSVPPAGRGYIEEFEQAEHDARTFTPLTDIRPTARLADAYLVQRELVARRIKRGDSLAGYRGGLMSAASMTSRGVDAPLVAAFFRSGRLGDRAHLSLCGYRKAAFELKIGFLFDESISGGPADMPTLKAAVARIIPFVDLPDIAYRNPDSYSAVDMVASNISSARYVIGKGGEKGGLDLDAMRITRKRRRNVALSASPK